MHHDEPIIAAIRVADAPNRPSPYFNGGTQYPCQECGAEVWMGPKTQDAADKGAPVYCAVCAIRLFGHAPESKAIVLVQLNPNLRRDMPMEQIERIVEKNSREARREKSL